MNSRRGSRTSFQQRRGAILIATLVCLSIIVALVGCMLLAAMQTGRHLHVERDLRQCELLLAAGIARAAEQATHNPGYRGEKWQVPAEQIIGKGAGEVTVEMLADSVNEKPQFRVVAEYPLGGETSIRRSHTLSISTIKPTRQE
jgi:hypothetical protein